MALTNMEKQSLTRQLILKLNDRLAAPNPTVEPFHPVAASAAGLMN